MCDLVCAVFSFRYVCRELQLHIFPWMRSSVGTKLSLDFGFW